MSQLLFGSICVSDLPQDRMKKASNGKWYLDINIWVNDQLDQYGNIAGVSVGQTKEEREAKVKRTYIGNLKTPQQQSPTPQYAPAPQQPAPQGPPQFGGQPAQGYQAAPQQQPAPAPQQTTGYTPF